MAASLVFASSMGACKSLPDDDNVASGNREPNARRPEGSDDDVTTVRIDVCKGRTPPTDSTAKVLFNDDFEMPNTTPVPNCSGYLDQKSGINTLYGTSDFRFAQAKTIEAVLLQDENGVYTDPDSRGGRYALGMLSDQEQDLLAVSFETDQQYVNVGLFLSTIAIKNCGPGVQVQKSRLKISLYDGALTDDQLRVSADEGTPLKAALLDSKTVDGNEIKDAWTFDWSPAVASLDASKATTGTVSVVFDLLEGGYAAIDNLSVVASNVKGWADLNNNGVSDDIECARGSAGGGVGAEGDEPVTTRDAGTAARDAGAAPVDAGAPVVTPPVADPPATPPAPPPPPPPPETSPAPPVTTRDAGTSSSSSNDDDDDEDREDEDEDEDDNPFSGIIDAIRGAGRGRSRSR